MTTVRPYRESEESTLPASCLGLVNPREAKLVACCGGARHRVGPQPPFVLTLPPPLWGSAALVDVSGFKPAPKLTRGGPGHPEPQGPQTTGARPTSHRTQLVSRALPLLHAQTAAPCKCRASTAWSVAGNAIPFSCSATDGAGVGPTCPPRAHPALGFSGSRGRSRAALDTASKDPRPGVALPAAP